MSEANAAQPKPKLPSRTVVLQFATNKIEFMGKTYNVSSANLESFCLKRGNPGYAPLSIVIISPGTGYSYISLSQLPFQCGGVTVGNVDPLRDRYLRLLLKPLLKKLGYSFCLATSVTHLFQNVAGATAAPTFRKFWSKSEVLFTNLKNKRSGNPLEMRMFRV